MRLEDQFVLVSHLGTIICFERGDFCHLAPRDASFNLALSSDGDIISCPRDSEAFIRTSIRRLGNSRFALTKGDLYLSAEHSGSLGRREKANAWEVFDLLPISSVLSRLMMPPPDFARKMRSHKIPKTIHQTYYTPLVPDSFLENVAKLRGLNPGWNFFYWSEKDALDFIYQYYGWRVLEFYLRINPRYGAMRADLFRYLLIYQLGGVYLDLKSGCSRPLSEIIGDSDQFLLAHWENAPGQQYAGYGLSPLLSHVRGGEFQQWHIIASSGHPFLEGVIERVLRNISEYVPFLHGVGREGGLWTTGPIAYTLAIHPLLGSGAHRFVVPSEVGLIYANVDGHPRKLGNYYGLQRSPVVL